MHPAKRQRVETSFDVYSYLFLGLKCSQQLVDTLVINAPCLFIKVLLRHVVSELTKWFQNQHEDPSSLHRDYKEYAIGRYNIAFTSFFGNRTCVVHIHYLFHTSPFGVRLELQCENLVYLYSVIESEVYPRLCMLILDTKDRYNVPYTERCWCYN